MFLPELGFAQAKNPYQHSPLILFWLFSKSGSKWDGGIENVYYDPCQNWLDQINMKLSSPNHPEPFNQNEDCTWEIIAPQGHYITLEFEIIDVCNKEFTLLQSDLA